jgi:hypothetical protein
MSDIRMLLAIPVLPVLSIEETLAYYEGRLGFRRYIDSNEYAGVELDGLQIHFWLCNDANLPQNSSCRINVAGVDALYGRFLASGVVGEDDAPRRKAVGLPRVRGEGPQRQPRLVRGRDPGLGRGVDGASESERRVPEIPAAFDVSKCSVGHFSTLIASTLVQVRTPHSEGHVGFAKQDRLLLCLDGESGCRRRRLRGNSRAWFSTPLS